MDVIIFNNGSGGVSVLRPAPKYLNELTAKGDSGPISTIALMDVPVILTQNGFINGKAVFIGDLVKRSEAANLTFNEVAYEIVDDSTLPTDKPRDLWGWV